MFSVKKLNSRERSSLLKQAHKLSPRVWIGKNGLTDKIVENVDMIIEKNELIKIKYLDFKDFKVTYSDTIAERTKSSVVKIVGNIAVLYRPSKDPEKRKIFP